jgi:FkbM family methyltransferase
MHKDTRTALIATISKNETLRPLSRLERLKRDPFGTFPYYVLAAISHIKPFKISFRTLWHTRMTCYLPEGNTFYYYGYCEANLTNFYIRFVQEGMTVIDVGAHVGIYSMLASELVGPTGHVYSFEPTPWTFRLLKENTEKLANVTITNQAVSAEAKTLTFADYGPGYGAFNSAHEAGATGISRTPTMVEVGSVSLDAFCAEQSITPAIIKIDAEGFEPEVLRGSVTLLTNTTSVRPLVSIEVAGGAVWAENSREAFSLLAEYGYQPFEMSDAGLLSPHTYHDSYTYDNLLFIPTERIESVTQTLTTL